jgi:uncharacterized membrane protein
MIWWFFAPLAFVGFLVLVAILLRWVLAPLACGKSRYLSHLRGDSAIQLLREKYAKGEITKEQFDEMYRNLKSNQA